MSTLSRWPSGDNVSGRLRDRDRGGLVVDGGRGANPGPAPPRPKHKNTALYVEGVASETTSIEKRWSRWSGTPVDVVRLARRAEELLAAANAEKPRARVIVKQQRGESIYESATEAAEHLHQVDLATVETVHLIAGDRWTDVGIVINFFRTGPFLLVEGRGDCRLAVAGIAEVMGAELDHGDRSYPHERAIGWALMAGCLVTSAGAIGAYAAGAPRGISLSLLVLVLVLSLGFCWILSLRVLLLPALELRRDEQQSRAERWGGRLRRFGGWALTLVLGAVLGALIQRWMG